MALWLAVWEIVCSTAGPAGMYACGARTIPKSSLLVSAGHSVSPSGEPVWSAVSSPGIPRALAVGSGQLLPNPPGVEVALDGQTLAHLPFSGNPAPLRLPVGTHVFTWRSHVYRC